MSFKLLAIRPLDGCRDKYRKNLEERRIYKFYNDYTFYNDDQQLDKFELKDLQDMNVNKILYRTSVPNDFYGENINISAIVGKNGSGKSSLVELLYIAFYNLSIRKKIIKTTAKFYYINDINVEIYCKIENQIYCIEFGKDITMIKYTAQDKSNSIFNRDSYNCLDFMLSQTNSFFYNIIINYSLYGLNSDEVGDWIQSLFHKNDGYQTPIVLNPMRTNGNFDINKETGLAKQRFITNLVYNYDLSSIGHNKKILSFDVELRGAMSENNHFNHFYMEFDYRGKYYDYPHDVFKKFILKFFFRYKLSEIIISDNYINFLLMRYISDKLIKITTKYEVYEVYKLALVRNAENDYIIDAVLLQEYLTLIDRDSSHITLKLKQAINFLFFNNLNEGKKDILFTNYYEKQTFVNNTINVFFDEINMKLDNCFNFFKTKTNCQAIYFLPPAIFNTNFQLNEGTFSDLSSGEKQKIYSLNSILYHIYNLDSAHSNNNKYKYHYLNIILDEIELYYHPEMQINYIKDLIDSLKKMKFKNIKGINFIFITHSPFILSDIPKQNVLFLESEDGIAISKDFSKKNTFAGNISELLEDSFFLENGLLGSFAKSKIEKTIEWLNIIEKLQIEKKQSNQQFVVEDKEKQKYKMIIEMIDEQVIYYKLREKYFEIFPEDFEEESKENIFKELAKQLGYKIEKE